MSAAAKSRARRQAAPHVRKFRGCVLKKIGSETIVIALPSGEVWGWASDWAQARRVVVWIQGLMEERP